ncbi:MAG: Na/Pi cotransporter family protein [Sphingobacteriia bacterium]|nr:Na/Pi cotransporter family protein [Sphingobacteriia bacterium]NCC39991.1 Na/Pi cotransporter family protein [Gammaproteobacteria bacterium]
MTRRILLTILFMGLGYGLWLSPSFKEIAAGVALFLFGMLSLERGFRSFTGGTLERVLRASTNRLWKSISFGIVSTTLMQSSTLVSLVTISFVSAEMITLAAGIGVIMGANLGTTTGAWLIAGLGLRVDIAAYAMPALVFGVVLLLQDSRTLKGLGYIAMGVGFLFLGIAYMKSGFDAFTQVFDLSAYAIPGFAGVLIYTGIGMAVTVIMQSSHATLLVIITALATNQISYDNALALAIGANLGSAVTTAIGGMTADLGGKRLAIAHVFFNLLSAVVAISLIHQVAWTVDYLAALIGIGADDHLLKLALFHTLFNLLGVILIAPFTFQLAAALERYVRFAPKPMEQPRYLYAGALETPGTAISALRKEVGRLYDNAYDLIARGLSLERALIDSDQSIKDAVRATQRIMPLDVDDVYERKIKSLHSAIIAFISETQGRGLEGASAEQLYELQQASRNIVAAVKGMKHLHKNLSRHAMSASPVVREPYDRIRAQIAKLLREIQQIRTQEAETVTSLSLDALKLSLETSSQQFTADLNERLRGQRLAPTVATSMMNDEAYSFEIGERLIEAAKALLQPGSVHDEAVENMLALDDEDIAQIAERQSHANPQGAHHGLQETTR